MTTSAVDSTQPSTRFSARRVTTLVFCVLIGASGINHGLFEAVFVRIVDASDIIGQADSLAS